ncbi:MAG: MBL fold metallo-hydrolase [Geminicoccaceae bacterium]|nr:MBL fold metallo-hydrolase [Geminicoccaceae bacterium]
MPTSLTFHGAASTVTGSCYVIDHDGGRLMIDCGLFQGTKTIRELNYRPFPFKPAGIDALVLTHAHIDHTGLVPKLTANGYKGPIFATEPTIDLMAFMLPDSGHIQESEVERVNQRNRKRGRPLVEPIYTRRDAEAVLELARAENYDEWFEPMKGIRARYWNAGHILGSASIELEVADRNEKRPIRILFSGDIGPDEKTFQDDPSGPNDVDYLICESTYGDRDREDLSLEARRARLRDAVNKGLGRGGNLLIPAFAVERTQELIYSLVKLMEDGEIPDAPIFIDSPLAIKVTETFARHRNSLHDIDPDMRIFRSPRIRFTQSVEESKAINTIRKGAIIMAASGMCDAGRIRHHLKNNLWRREASVLFVGYQAPGSLGHLILSGEKRVRIHGEEIEVNCDIQRIDSYSAHADQGELVQWVKERLPVRNTIFLSHGEPDAMKAFREHLAAAGCNPRHILTPELDDRFELSLGGEPARHAEHRRLSHEQAAADHDWHSAYARLLLDLGKRLDTIENSDVKLALLERMREALTRDQRA